MTNKERTFGLYKVRVNEILRKMFSLFLRHRLHLPFYVLSETEMEFLPLCDVLFNIISLAGYFCDVVFDVVFCYALLERGRTTYSAVVISTITFSLITSQVRHT